MKTKSFLFASLSLLLAGCWTVSETEFPAVTTVPAPSGKQIKVKLSGYRTGAYNYVPVEGHELMTGPSEIGPQKDAVAHTDTSSSLEWYLQRTAAGMLVSRTLEELERLGYVIERKEPQYIIDMAFEGPVFPDHDVLRQLTYGICTIFTAENSALKWAAKLTVRDGATKKVLLCKDYTMDYSVTVWGPIPVASPACSPKTMVRAGNSWALTALNDMAIADATKFIADQNK